jgi:hypothetical protein
MDAPPAHDQRRQNCPRYIPTMQLVEPSIYTPRAGYEPPEPAWKGFDSFNVHPRQPTFKGDRSVFMLPLHFSCCHANGEIRDLLTRK